MTPARALAFGAFGAWGALAWGSLVAPPRPAATLAGVALGLTTWPALRLVSRMGHRGGRGAARTALAGAQIALVLAAAGAPARLLAPDGWAALVSGIGQGVAALPAVSVPYAGADHWVHTVLLAGGGLLAVAAAWLAVRGSRVASAVLLVALYGTAIVQHGPRAPFLAGAVLALLLVAYLFADRVVAAESGAALVLAVAATILAAVVAPGLDRARPLLDYERIAESLRAEPTATFDWTHDYGPLRWRRDGHEVLRISARHPAYWKAADLDLFDGVRWRAGAQSADAGPDTEFAQGRASWHQTIGVVVRGLSSREYIGAGTTESILGSPRDVVRADPGTFVTGDDRPLGPGDDYRARVYTPRPSAAQLRGDTRRYPSFTSAFLLMGLPRRAGGPPPAARVAAIQFPAWGERAPVRTLYDGRFPSGDGAALLAASRYARAYALAQSLRQASATPYDFVRRVMRRVRVGAVYTEDPSRHDLPLEAFLFTDREGYCQQFSGAMALLLRMGGVPARVAAGFAPGGYDQRLGEYVVRDFDAHSWVEAYFPGFGWVPFDPTPSIAPPRAQAGDEDVSAATGDQRDTGGVGTRAEDPTGPEPVARSGSTGDYTLPAALLGGLALLLAIVMLGARRLRAPAPPAPRDVAELIRALRRTGRAPDAPLTLVRLERLLDGDGGYVRALRERRYAGRGTGPTPAQRRALRRCLAAGLGMPGRLRAWWALPPRLPL